jgi:mannose-6-phosphate isomerase-like protein (cupin superfamily)
MPSSCILHVRHDPSVPPTSQLGPYGITSLIPPDSEGALTAYRVSIAPHQTTSVSFHKIAEEIYFVISGHGTAVLNGSAYALAPGDFLRLPPGTTHGFITLEEPLEMLDLHSPGSRPDRDVYFQGEVPPGFGPAFESPHS